LRQDGRGCSSPASNLDVQALNKSESLSRCYGHRTENAGGSAAIQHRQQSICRASTGIEAWRFAGGRGGDESDEGDDGNGQARAHASIPSTAFNLSRQMPSYADKAGRLNVGIVEGTAVSALPKRPLRLNSHYHEVIGMRNVVGMHGSWIICLLKMHLAPYRFPNPILGEILGGFGSTAWASRAGMTNCRVDFGVSRWAGRFGANAAAEAAHVSSGMMNVIGPKPPGRTNKPI
jgi:hypothetical protein